MPENPGVQPGVRRPRNPPPQQRHGSWCSTRSSTVSLPVWRRVGLGEVQRSWSCCSACAWLG